MALVCYLIYFILLITSTRLLKTTPTVGDYSIQKSLSNFNDLLIAVNVDRASNLIHEIIHNDLKAPDIQNKLKRSEFVRDYSSFDVLLEKAVTFVAKKLRAISESLNRSAKEISNTYSLKQFDVQAFKLYRECCLYDRHLLCYDSLFETKLNFTNECDIMSRSLPHIPFNPKEEILKLYKSNIKNQHVSFKWQYFISVDGLRVEYPAHVIHDSTDCASCGKSEHLRHSSIFVKSSLPFKKKIVILIDRGYSMSEKEIDSAKCVAKSLITSLSDEDQVGVLLVDKDITYIGCLNRGQYIFSTTYSDRQNLLDHVSTFTQTIGTITNHTLGLMEAFKLLNHSTVDARTRSVIIYISRGLLTQFTEAIAIMATLAQSNSKVNNQVQISTVALVNHSKPLLWETMFLKDIASQNFHQYAQSFPADVIQMLKTKPKPPEGKTLIVNSSDALCISLREIFDILKPADFQLLKPFELAGSLTYFIDFPEMQISLGKAVFQQDNFIGVVGVDVALDRLASHISSFASWDPFAYAFMVDFLGRIIMHPKLKNGKTNLQDFNWLEEHCPFSFIINSNQEGFHVVDSMTSLNDSSAIFSNVTVYKWKKIPGIDAVIVIKSTNFNGRFHVNNKSNVNGILTRSLTYHRVDLSMIRESVSCSQGKLLFNLDKCGLYLAPKVFERHYEKLNVVEDLRSSQGYWAYITDRTKLITNPGLKSENIRSNIAEWSNILHNWCQIQSGFTIDGDRRKNIFRRYIALPNGVLFTYPTFQIANNFDATSTSWYQDALRIARQNDSNVAISSPYLDNSGLGYLTPLSVVLKDFHGKVSAVASIHLPVTYLRAKLSSVTRGACQLNATYPVQHNAKQHTDDDCFAFDDRLYVTIHKNNFDADTSPSQTLEQMHLTHKEPTFATEILQNDQFVRKDTCRNLRLDSNSRFYRVNNSFNSIVKSNDACQRYQVALIPNTNLYLAIVNRSCFRPSFCPCSVVDRKCLNCKRSEPKECECPCECPDLKQSSNDFCNSRLLDAAYRPKFCGRYHTSTSVMSTHAVESSSFLNSPANKCLKRPCIEFKSEKACLLAIGCQWCSLNDDFRTPLKEPFCSPVFQCFGSVLGLSSYFDSAKSIYTTKSLLAKHPASSNQIGPVAGGIILSFTFLLASVLWYRRKLLRLLSGENHRGSIVNGIDSCGGLILDRHHVNSTDHDTGPDVDTKTLDSQLDVCLLLTSFERESNDKGAPLIKPRLPWRRGPRTIESSDHGYSTMTGGNCDESDNVTTIIKETRFLQHRPSYAAAQTACSSSDDLSTTVTKASIDKDENDGKFSCQLDASADLVLQTVLENGQRYLTTAIVHAVNS